MSWQARGSPGVDEEVGPLEAPADREAAPASDRARQIEQLFREHNKALVSFLTVRLRSEQEAREVAQEAYVRLLQLDRPDASGFMRALLFKTALNLAIDRLRVRSLHARTPLDDLFEDLLFTPTPEHKALAAEEIDVMRRALRELPPKSAQAFTLHMLACRDVRDVAKEMQIPERTVRYHVLRAFEHCRARLEEFRKT